jgi:hypothetical protein
MSTTETIDPGTQAVAVQLSHGDERAEPAIAAAVAVGEHMGRAGPRGVQDRPLVPWGALSRPATPMGTREVPGLSPRMPRAVSSRRTVVHGAQFGSSPSVVCRHGSTI